MYEAPWLYTEKGHPDTTAHAVLAVLAEHADKNGRNARPGPLRIRFATGFDVRTIDRAMRRLEAAKLIEDDGRTYSGARRWKLAITQARPESFWDDLVAEDEQARQVESDARQFRRRNEKARLPGTQNPGHIEDDVSVAAPVRDADCQTPGSSVPDAGTQNAGRRDVKSGCRHATPPEPPEPSLNHPLNHPPTTPGGAPPPDPRRLPPPTASGTDLEGSRSGVLTPAQDQQGESLPHAGTREATPELRLLHGAEQPAPGPPRGLFPVAVPDRRQTPAEATIAAAVARRAAARAAHNGQGAAR